MRKPFLIVEIVAVSIAIANIPCHSQEVPLTVLQRSVQDTLRRTMPGLEVSWNRRSGLPTLITGIRTDQLSLAPESLSAYFATTFGPLYRISDVRTELSTDTVTRDQYGYRHLRMHQRHGSIPVYGGLLILTLDQDRRLKSISGKWLPVAPGIDTVPRLSPDQAADSVLSYLRAQYEGEEPLPPDLHLEPDVVQLVIFDPGVYTDSLTAGRLTYRMIAKTHVFFIDAHTGAVIYSYSNIQSPLSPGFWSHKVVVGGTSETFRSQRRKTVYAEGRASQGHLASVTIYASTGCSEQTSGLLARSRETHESDDCFDLPGTLVIDESGPVGGAIPDAQEQNAHDFAGATYDYYFNTHGRDSYDNSGSTIVSTVHSGVPVDIITLLICCILNLDCCGCLDANAAWIPSLSQMVYGDGGTLADGRSFNAFTDALDVVAHELTHGVIQHSILDAAGDAVGLDYTGESGALNESFADVFGVMVDRDDWLMGEDLVVAGYPAGAMRNLADPTNGGLYDPADPTGSADAGHQPDHMDDYVAGGNVHINSGIPNNAVYLMAEGGVHAHSGIAVPSMGRDATERVLYRALTTYLTQAASFLDYRNALLQSVEELYPGDAAKYASVWNALAAVGICDPTAPETCVPFGPVAARDPVEIVVVLDYSSSMNSAAEPGGRDKIEVLQDAAEIFLRTWEIFAMPTDRVDVVYFNSDVQPLSLNLQPLIGNVDAVAGEIRGGSATGFTAMGGGLQVALEGLSGGSHPSIVLFTNGIQNVNPMVEYVPAGHHEIVNSSGAWGGTSSVPEAPGTSLSSYGVPVHIVGIGAAAATSYHELLDGVTTETGGLLHLTTEPDANLRRFFLEDLVAALNLNTLEMVAYRHGTVGPDQGINEEFVVDGTVNRAAFMVNWTQTQLPFPTVRIDGPQNVNLPPTRWVDGRFYRMAVYDFPYSRESGTIEYVGTWRLSSDASPNANIAYQATLLLDERDIRYDFAVRDRAIWAGDTLRIAARVTDNDEPVTDLDRARVILEQPRTALGTFLSVHPDTGVGPRNDLLSSRAHRKLLSLLEEPELRLQLAPLTTVVQMYDDGRAEHGDLQARDGTFSAQLTNTRVPGLYRVTWTVAGETERGGPFERTATSGTILRVKPDRNMTELRAKWLPEDPESPRTIAVFVVPKDRFGNYVGPGRSGAIRVTAPPSVRADAPQDFLDGSYEIQLSLADPGSDPNVAVRMSGFELYNGPVSGIPTAERRVGLSAHVGTSIPHGTFAQTRDPGVSFSVDLEYRLNRLVSLEVLAGMHTFIGNGASDSTYWAHLSGNIRVSSAGRIGLFIQGGPGGYVVENGSKVHPGVNVGGGVAVRIATDMDAVAAYGFHSIFLSTDDIRFSTVQAGIHWRP